MIRLERYVVMQGNTQNQGNNMAQVEMRQCIEDCMNCYNVCIQTARACQQAGGDHAEQGHIWMLLDCAEICQAAAHFMEHENPLYGYVTSAAAQITAHCGEECAQMGDNDCADACENASWSLQQISKIVPS